MRTSRPGTAPPPAPPTGSSGPRATRRGVLAAAAALTAGSLGLAGCRDSDRPAAADQLAPVLADTLALLARYDAALPALPDWADRLTELRAETAAHAAALTRAMGRTVTPTRSAGPAPSDGTPAALLADLREAERQGQLAAARACLAAPAATAALLASIAACRASHQDVLR